MDAGFRELIDALKVAGSGMHAQAQGHHNVVEAVNHLEDAVTELGRRFEESEKAKTAEALAELAKQQAIVNDREERSDAFHREIIETTGSVVSSTVKSAGNFLTSKPMTGIYGFAIYALMSWASGCFGSPRSHELLNAWSKFWVGYEDSSAQSPGNFQSGQGNPDVASGKDAPSTTPLVLPSKPATVVNETPSEPTP